MPSSLSVDPALKLVVFGDGIYLARISSAWKETQTAVLISGIRAEETDGANRHPLC